MKRNWKFLGTGWDRTTYLIDERIVLKFPKNAIGEECNIFEALNWFNSENQCIQTKLIKINGFQCAVQPYLKPVDNNDKPDWAGYYDGQQGGLDKGGKFKIYDFPPNWMGNAIRAYGSYMD